MYVRRQPWTSSPRGQRRRIPQNGISGWRRQMSSIDLNRSPLPTCLAPCDHPGLSGGPASRSGTHLGCSSFFMQLSCMYCFGMDIRDFSGLCLPSLMSKLAAKDFWNECRRRGRDDVNWRIPEGHLVPQILAAGYFYIHTYVSLYLYVLIFRCTKAPSLRLASSFASSHKAPLAQPASDCKRKA